MIPNFDPETYYDKKEVPEFENKPRKFNWLYFEYWATKKTNELGQPKDWVEFTLDVIQKKVENEKY